MPQERSLTPQNFQALDRIAERVEWFFFQREQEAVRRAAAERKQRRQTRGAKAKVPAVKA